MSEHHPRSSLNKERRYWERHAGRYDKSLGPLGKPIPRMLDLVGEAIAGRNKVLEVAAGTGLVTPVIAKVAREVVATDYAVAMVERLIEKMTDRGLNNVECRQADIYELPFDPASFDVVVAANVLHLVPDLEGALAAFKRVLRPSGIVVTPTFCHGETWTSWIVSRLLAITGFPGHRRFTANSLRETLEQSGIEIHRHETLPGLIPIGYVDGQFA